MQNKSLKENILLGFECLCPPQNSYFEILTLKVDGIRK